MAAPQPSTVVIVCPHCTTRYQVPGETIGAKGRQVQCAHCGKAWQAFAEKVVEPPPPPPPARPAAKKGAPAPAETEDDRMFDADAEAELDAEFEAEQRKTAESEAAEERDALMAEAERALADAKAALAPRTPPPPPPPPTPADRKREKAFSRRQEALTRQLPMARIRRTLRIVGVGALTLMLVGGIVFRTDLVRLFPDLAGVYESVGLGVNVVGLDFRDVKTLLVRRNGTEALQVDARIYSVAPGQVSVPAVLVTLLNEEGAPLYEWASTPAAGAMQPGEILEFSSQLTMPPAGASKVRLTFTKGGARTPTPADTAALPAESGAEPGAAAPAADSAHAEPASAEHNEGH